MQARFRSILVPLLAVAFLGGDCGDDPMMINPAPDLSGTYDLVSFTQAGVTLVPPVARGTLVATQTSSSGSVASGTYVIDITTPAGNTVDQGTYTNSSDGTWTQASSTQGFQFLGMVTVLGGTLTVEVTQPAAAANTTVWQRR